MCAQCLLAPIPFSVFYNSVSNSVSCTESTWDTSVCKMWWHRHHHYYYIYILFHFIFWMDENSWHFSTRRRTSCANITFFFCCYEYRQHTGSSTQSVVHNAIFVRTDTLSTLSACDGKRKYWFNKKNDYYCYYYYLCFRIFVLVRWSSRDTNRYICI